MAILTPRKLLSWSGSNQTTTELHAAGARETKTGARETNRRDPPAWGCLRRSQRDQNRSQRHQTEGRSLRSTGETRRDPPGAVTGVYYANLPDVAVT